MSKQDEAGLILKLYELRREEVMRKARDWFVVEFNPESIEDYTRALFSERSGYVRMVVTYWEMAAALVNNGAISKELFNDSNGEQLVVFAKIEPLLGQIRAEFGPQFAVQLEKLIDATPQARDRLPVIRERMKGIRAEVARKQAKTAQSA